MPIRRKFYRRRARKYARKTKTTRRGVSQRVKKYVKAQIHRNIENKDKIFYAVNQPILSSDRATGTWPLIPTFTQGTGDDNRIGNAIRVMQGQIKMAINLLPYDATTNPNILPTWVKLWVVRDLKNVGQLSSMDATSYANFFRTNGTTVSFQGNCLDMTLPVNESYFRVLYTKTFKLGVSGVYNVAPVSGNVNSFTDNSPSAKLITINWGKWCKKQLKFTEGNSYPNNDNLYLVIQSVSADGTTSAGKFQVEFHYTDLCRFEDA